MWLLSSPWSSVQCSLSLTHSPFYSRRTIRDPYDHYIFLNGPTALLLTGNISKCSVPLTTLFKIPQFHIPTDQLQQPFTVYSTTSPKPSLQVYFTSVMSRYDTTRKLVSLSFQAQLHVFHIVTITPYEFHNSQVQHCHHFNGHGKRVC